MAINLTIVEQIKILQDRNNVSTKTMAEIIGVTPQNYSRRIRLNSFSSEELEKIADFFQYSIELIPKK